MEAGGDYSWKVSGKFVEGTPFRPPKPRLWKESWKETGITHGKSGNGTVTASGLDDQNSAPDASHICALCKGRAVGPTADRAAHRNPRPPR